MIKTRNLPEQEKFNIRNWPKYNSPYEKLDYSLRKGGWLDTFGKKTTCIKLGFYENSELIGFSLLDRKGKNEAEFYLAIKGDKLSVGYGKKICILTLKKAFTEYKLNRVFLKVRTDHQIGIQLYESLGFKYVKNYKMEINGLETEFFYYELYPNDFKFQLD